MPPNITGPSGKHYVTEGSPSTEFQYSVLMGNPFSYYIMWELNGSIFNGNARISLVNDDKTLVLQYPLQVDSGIYTVTAGNGVGSTSLNLELTIVCKCVSVSVPFMLEKIEDIFA